MLKARRKHQKIKKDLEVAAKAAKKQATQVTKEPVVKKEKVKKEKVEKVKAEKVEKVKKVKPTKEELGRQESKKGAAVVAKKKGA